MIKEIILIILMILGLTPLRAEQKGKASFYSKRATGARTSSGERIHHDSLTCAHLTYPFGTMLRVRNLSNGKEVVVKVTDRGPHRRGRIIDLTLAAARELDMVSQGIATVSIRVEPNIKIPFRNDTPIELPQIDIAGIIEENPIKPPSIKAWAKDKVKSTIKTIKKNSNLIKDEK